MIEIKITIIGVNSDIFLKNFINEAFIKNYTKTFYNLSAEVNTTEGFFKLKINELNSIFDNIDTDVFFLLYDSKKVKTMENVLIYYKKYFNNYPNILIVPFNEKIEISYENKNPFLKAIKFVTNNNNNNFSFIKYNEIDSNILFDRSNFCFYGLNFCFI